LHQAPQSPASRPSVASETAAITLAFHVRKSLALKSSPSCSLRKSLMSSEILRPFSPR
jgi:hypothetical protein